MNLTERILELLKSDTLKMREVAGILGANTGIVSSTISRLVRQGLVVVVDKSRKNHWTYRAAKKGRSVKDTKSKVDKELSKHFRLFRPAFGNVMGVWV